MKFILPLTAILLFLAACNDPQKPAHTATEKNDPDKQRFFPVTTYLKGEIFNLKKAGINPLKYTTVNNHTDSVWLKVEELDAVFQEFLNPEIDSSNLITLFTERSFLDQSINAVTFTYDPTAVLPDTLKLKHWDVYINPDKNTVKRIYMVKEINKNTTLQLTWVSNQWCKITSIISDEKGISRIEKEEKIIWDF